MDLLKIVKEIDSKYYFVLKDMIPFIYIISQKSCITYSLDYNFARMRTESYNSLPIEKH